MADIDVVKKRSSMWPWIIGLIALVVIVWLVMSMMGTPATDTGRAPAVSMPSLEPLAATLKAYIHA